MKLASELQNMNVFKQILANMKFIHRNQIQFCWQFFSVLPPLGLSYNILFKWLMALDENESGNSWHDTIENFNSKIVTFHQYDSIEKFKYWKYIFFVFFIAYYGNNTVQTLKLTFMTLVFFKAFGAICFNSNARLQFIIIYFVHGNDINSNNKQC